MRIITTVLVFLFSISASAETIVECIQGTLYVRIRPGADGFKGFLNSFSACETPEDTALYVTQSQDSEDDSLSFEFSPECFAQDSNTLDLVMYFSKMEDQLFLVDIQAIPLECAPLPPAFGVSFEFNAIAAVDDPANDDNALIPINAADAITYSIQRYTSNVYDTLEPSLIVDTSQKLYLQFAMNTAFDLINKPTWNIRSCSTIVKVGDTDEVKLNYRLFDFYDADYCMDEFLSVAVDETAADPSEWRLEYESFVTADSIGSEESMSLTCEIYVCYDAAEYGGWCPNNTGDGKSVRPECDVSPMSSGRDWNL